MDGGTDDAGGSSGESAHSPAADCTHQPAAAEVSSPAPRVPGAQRLAEAQRSSQQSCTTAGAGAGGGAAPSAASSEAAVPLPAPAGGTLVDGLVDASAPSRFNYKAGPRTIHPDPFEIRIPLERMLRSAGLEALPKDRPAALLLEAHSQLVLFVRAAMMRSPKPSTTSEGAAAHSAPDAAWISPPGLSLLLASRACAHGRQGAWDLALADAAQALRHDPTNTLAMAWAAISYEAVGDRLRALRLFTAVAARSTREGDHEVALAAKHRVKSLRAPIATAAHRARAACVAKGGWGSHTWEALMGMVDTADEAVDGEEPLSELDAAYAASQMMEVVAVLNTGSKFAEWRVLQAVARVLGAGGRVSDAGRAQRLIHQLLVQLEACLGDGDTPTAMPFTTALDPADSSMGASSLGKAAKMYAHWISALLMALDRDGQLSSAFLVELRARFSQDCALFTHPLGAAWLLPVIMLPVDERVIVVAVAQRQAFAAVVRGVTSCGQLHALLVAALHKSSKLSGDAPPAPLVATLCDSRDAPEATEAAGGEWSSPWNLLQYSTIDDTGSVNCKLRTFEADLDVLAPEMPFADIFSINHRRVVILAPSADDLPMRISLRTCWPQGTSRLRVPASVSVDESRPLAFDEMMALCTVASIDEAAMREREELEQ